MSTWGKALWKIRDFLRIHHKILWSQRKKQSKATIGIPCVMDAKRNAHALRVGEARASTCIRATESRDERKASFLIFDKNSFLRWFLSGRVDKSTAQENPSRGKVPFPNDGTTGSQSDV
jgi:hypothetical protein